ncbi:Proton-coupled folate transporter [Nymphon striatum]|nr:Proton-coupled folate transporter [Nymphon striatum]
MNVSFRNTQITCPLQHTFGHFICNFSFSGCKVMTKFELGGHFGRFKLPNNDFIRFLLENNAQDRLTYVDVSNNLSLEVRTADETDRTSSNIYKELNSSGNEENVVESTTKNIDSTKKSTMAIDMLFAQNRYNWTSYQYGNMFGTMITVNVVMLALGSLLFIKKLKLQDINIAFIGFTSGATGFVITAFAYYQWMFYTGKFSGALAALPDIIIQSRLTKLVDVSEIGKIMTIRSAITALAGPETSIGFIALYKFGLDFFLGFPYLVAATLYIGCMGLIDTVALEETKKPKKTAMNGGKKKTKPAESSNDEDYYCSIMHFKPIKNEEVPPVDDETPRNEELEMMEISPI